MKSNRKKSNITLGLMLIIGLSSLHNIGNLENANTGRYEQNMILDDLKTSGTYLNITIDDLPGNANNWAWAENQVWCSGSGTLLDPYIIEGHILNMSRSIDGLRIYNSHNKHFIIRNCTFKWDGVTNSILMTGITLLNTTHGRIEDNLIYHLGYGILLEDCENINVTGNILYDHTYGIKLEDSDFNNIIGNTASNNSLGTTLGIYLYFSDNNTVSGNIANNNDHGIYLEESNGNIVSVNIENGNSQNGIYLYFCDYNNITENIIYDNTIGINIDTGNDNNLIYKNFFLNNGIHAIDNGTANKWNTSAIGNYWDNHTSPDTSPLDGIVDDPYTYISGSAGGIDYLPIAEDGVPIITVNSPSEGGRFGNTAPTFSLTVTDIYIVSMWYTLDDGQHNYTFTGLFGTIGQSAWDASSDGTITITFYALDIAGNIGTADITIGKNIPEEFDPTIVVVIVVISIVGGVAVLAGLYIVMKRRATP